MIAFPMASVGSALSSTERNAALHSHKSNNNKNSSHRGDGNDCSSAHCPHFTLQPLTLGHTMRFTFQSIATITFPFAFSCLAVDEEVRLLLRMLQMDLWCFFTNTFYFISFNFALCGFRFILPSKVYLSMHRRNQIQGFAHRTHTWMEQGPRGHQ